MALSAEDVIIQVRQKLRDRSVKLWLEPYYFEDIGPIESELDILARDFEQILRIPWTDCKIALIELQEGALEKLRSRNNCELTGEATFKARVIKKGAQNNDNFTVIELKHPLVTLGSEVYQYVSQKLQCEENNLKIIIAGRVLQKEKNLISQGVKNNSPAIILVSTDDNTASIHERVKKAKDDAMLILSSSDQEFFTVEDQDGNLLHLPSEERNSLMLALALYEKGRSALKRKDYEEAMVLFLESDEQFSSCKSEILGKVDNYALLNLDIVWCYLCLKSFSYLHDADKRLKICEENFKRSYGSDFNRLSQLKEDLIGNEQALIIRLHLLQGVLFFHQNKRDEAFEKFLTVENEISRLEIDEEKLINMLNMGYDLLESKIALRACGNSIDKAINFITERNKKKEEARKRAKKERNVMKEMKNVQGNDCVNPKTVVTLVEMGFETEIAAVALKKSDNDLARAIDLIQNNSAELRKEIPKIEPNSEIVNQLCNLGFKKEMVEMALKSLSNNKDEAIDFLLKLHSEDDIESILHIIEKTDAITTCMDVNQPGPSTFNSKSNMASVIKKKIDKEKETIEAYDRFSKDVSTVEDEYLDINFVEEKNILKEYKKLICN